MPPKSTTTKAAAASKATATKAAPKVTKAVTKKVQEVVESESDEEEEPVAPPKKVTAKSTKATKAVVEPVADVKKTTTKTTKEEVTTTTSKKNAPLVTGFAAAIKQDGVKKAVKALRAFLSGETNASKKLIENEGGYFELQVNLKKAQIKPTQISIPITNSIYKRPGVTICLLTKDPQDEWEDYLLKNPVANVTRVVSVKKLATDFKPFEHRRLLHKQHDLFVADEAIVPMLKQLVGKIFYQGTKQPIKVSFKRKFKQTIQTARDSTHFTIPAGQTFTIRIGHADLSDEEIVQNIIDFIPKLQRQLPKSGLSSLLLKTEFSASLPLYVNLALKTDFVATMEEKQAKIAKTVQIKQATLESRAQKLKLSVASLKKAQAAAKRCQMTLPKYLKVLKQHNKVPGDDVEVTKKEEAAPKATKATKKTAAASTEMTDDVAPKKKATTTKAAAPAATKAAAPAVTKTAAKAKKVVEEEAPVVAPKTTATKRKAAPKDDDAEPVVAKVVKKSRK